METRPAVPAVDDFPGRSRPGRREASISIVVVLVADADHAALGPNPFAITAATAADIRIIVIIVIVGIGAVLVLVFVMLVFVVLAEMVSAAMAAVSALRGRFGGYCQRSRCEKQESWVAQGPKPLHGRFLEDVESA